MSCPLFKEKKKGGKKKALPAFSVALKLIMPDSAGSRPAVIFMVHSFVRPVFSCFSLCQILIIWGKIFHTGCCWLLPKLNVWFVFGQKLLSCLWEGVWGKQDGGLGFFFFLFFPQINKQLGPFTSGEGRCCGRGAGASRICSSCDPQAELGTSPFGMGFTGKSGMAVCE